MPLPPPPGDLRRMRRPLDAVLLDDGSPARGKVIWLDEGVVHLLARRKLAPGQSHSVRIDLGAAGGPIVVEMDVEHIRDGHRTMYKWGWLHVGRYRLISGKSREDLARRLSEVNPSVSVAGSISTTPGRARQTTSVGSTVPEPVSVDTSGMARRSGRARVMRSMARRALKGSKADSSKDRTQDRRDRIVRPEPSEAPRKAVPESRIVQPVYSPGPPPGLFASFTSRATLAPALEFDDNGVCTVLANVPEVEVGDVLELLLQLPDDTMVQLISMVLRKGTHRVYIQSDFVAPEVMALLRSWV